MPFRPYQGRGEDIDGWSGENDDPEGDGEREFSIQTGLSEKEGNMKSKLMEGCDAKAFLDQGHRGEHSFSKVPLKKRDGKGSGLLSADDRQGNIGIGKLFGGAWGTHNKPKEGMKL